MKSPNVHSICHMPIPKAIVATDYFGVAPPRAAPPPPPSPSCIKSCLPRSFSRGSFAGVIEDATECSFPLSNNQQTSSVCFASGNRLSFTFILFVSNKLRNFFCNVFILWKLSPLTLDYSGFLLSKEEIK